VCQALVGRRLASAENEHVCSDSCFDTSARMGNGEDTICHTALILVKHTRSAASYRHRRFAIVATSKHANHVACCFARALLCLVAAQCNKQVRMCCFKFKGLSCAVNAVSRPHSEGTCSCKKHLRRYSPAALSRPHAALFSTALSAVSTQVKSHLGKVVYKGDFLPLLRKYRQDQDTARLTAGARPERCSE
jgi:hypothetical protein